MKWRIELRRNLAQILLTRESFGKFAPTRMVLRTNGNFREMFLFRRHDTAVETNTTKYCGLQVFLHHEANKRTTELIIEIGSQPSSTTSVPKFPQQPTHLPRLMASRAFRRLHDRDVPYPHWSYDRETKIPFLAHIGAEH